MSNDINRRSLITRAAVGSAAAGAIWVAPTVLGGASAFALGTPQFCPTNTTADWTDFGSRTSTEPKIDQDISFSHYYATAGLNGVTVRVTVRPQGSPGNSTNDGGSHNNGGVNGGTVGPYSAYPSHYQIRMTNSTQDQLTQGYDLVLEFFDGDGTSTPASVRGLTFTVIDLDRQVNAGRTGGWWDAVWLNNSAFTTSSETASPNWTGAGSSSDTFRQNPLSDQNGNQTSQQGDVRVTYTTDVNAVTMSYRNAGEGFTPKTGDYFGQWQSVGMSSFSFCVPA